MIAQAAAAASMAMAMALEGASSFGYLARPWTELSDPGAGWLVRGTAINAPEVVALNRLIRYSPTVTDSRCPAHYRNSLYTFPATTST